MQKVRDGVFGLRCFSVPLSIYEDDGDAIVIDRINNRLQAIRITAFMKHD